KGKVFTILLGHVMGGDTAPIRCIGFQTMLCRGAEWAATGQVTIPVPKKFPTATQARFAPIRDKTRPFYVRGDDLPHTNTIFKPTKYTSLEQWKTQRQWLRGQVRFAAGLCPEPQRTPLNAKIFGKMEMDGCTIEKVYFESRPGFFVTGNLYRPINVQGKVPAVACPHGHWKKGRIHHDKRGSIPARCITLARLGAVVFAYDMIGFNDSGRQIEHRIDTDLLTLWGISSLSLQTWNSIRVLDFLQSLPEVDPQRIGVTGASGGGTQTFILSAIDDRVKVAAPVCMISSTMQGGCICENTPCLRIETNNMEIGALFAPKPLLLISVIGDWTKNTPQVEYPMIRSIYQLYGAAERVANKHFNAGHNYNLDSRQAMYPFFAKWLLKRSDAHSITEGEIKLENPEDLLTFNENNLPANMLEPQQLYQQIKTASRKRIESLRPTDKTKLQELTRVVRFGLMHAVATNFPAKDRIEVKNIGSKHVDQHNQITQSYTRNRRSVKAKTFSATWPSKTPHRATICVHPAGLAAVDPLQDFIRQRANWGDNVILTEPFGTGQAKPPVDLDIPRGYTQFFTTFNRTDTAETVYDILTVLAATLHDENIRQVNLVGFGEMGPLCLIARALIPDQMVKAKDLRTVIDINAFDTNRDAAYINHLNLPNIQRIGGLPAIAAATTNGTIHLHNTKEQFNTEWFKQAAKIYRTPAQANLGQADLKTIAHWLGQ
ncbi:MAG: alpha/beta hydrolase family protein, partial [Planctomycetota bacterium]